MNRIRNNIVLVINSIFIIVTGAVNTYGFFNLPDTIATQFSLRGGQVNTMPKEIYLLISFAIVLILTVLCLKGDKEKRIKYTIINAVITIANLVMIIVQL